MTHHERLQTILIEINKQKYITFDRLRDKMRYKLPGYRESVINARLDALIEELLRQKYIRRTISNEASETDARYKASADYRLDIYSLRQEGQDFLEAGGYTRTEHQIRRSVWHRSLWVLLVIAALAAMLVYTGLRQHRLVLQVRSLEHTVDSLGHAAHR